MDSASPADGAAARHIEVTFHTSGSVLSDKDLDLMMSLHAEDAALTDTTHGNKVYQGRDQVRTYWHQRRGDKTLQ
jgi:ketosteroid isomerase-like protein